MLIDHPYIFFCEIYSNLLTHFLTRLFPYLGLLTFFQYIQQVSYLISVLQTFSSSLFIFVLWRAKIFLFWSPIYLFFKFMVYDFWIRPKKTLLTLRSQRFSPMFSPMFFRKFDVLCLCLWFMIHSELIS